MYQRFTITTKKRKVQRIRIMKNARKRNHRNEKIDCAREYINEQELIHILCKFAFVSHFVVALRLVLHVYCKHKFIPLLNSRCLQNICEYVLGVWDKPRQDTSDETNCSSTPVPHLPQLNLVGSAFVLRLFAVSLRWAWPYFLPAFSAPCVLRAPTDGGEIPATFI